jgi:HPr kinase/phosphorylase
MKYTKEYDVPLFGVERSTSQFISAVISFLSNSLAPKITRHGVLVEIYGEGVLIMGESGIGKSETAIELIKRGHRLVADDAVEISKMSDVTLVGRAPSIIKYYMELRGIGIVDIRRIFGTGSVKESEKIELIVKFEHWIEGKMYDRMGLDTEYTDILGIKIPTITVPVHAGRNLAVILEIAAMNNRLKKMGYNTAEEFNRRLEEEFQA